MMENNEFLILMGQKIRAARKVKKMPISIQAGLSKMDLSNLSFLERGKRNFLIVSSKSIADVLEVDGKELL